MNVKWVLPPLAVLFLSTGCLEAQATEDSRRSKGEAVITALSGGAGQPVLQAMHADFPFLASATTDFALGEVWGRTELDVRTRQLATVAVFAAQGNLPQMKIHAGYALRAGVSPAELKEMIYLTTVTAGFPRAIDAAQALREVLATQQASER